jgi:hypothetical protein
MVGRTKRRVKHLFLGPSLEDAPMPPLQLNDEEMTVLLTLAGPIDQRLRPQFLQEVAAELEAKRQAGEVGEGAGEITPGEGADLNTVVAGFVKALETSELEARIAALEKEINQ